ncbi:hypothetical protein B0H13DRAFT_2073713 [Mycena leptocephala]|nr:hypothetical protein B0H13DRAFT_2073713 [Mycena leptocephala]
MRLGLREHHLITPALTFALGAWASEIRGTKERKGLDSFGGGEKEGRKMEARTERSSPRISTRTRVRDARYCSSDTISRARTNRVLILEGSFIRIQYIQADNTLARYYLLPLRITPTIH